MSEQKLWERILHDSSQSKRHRDGNLILVGQKGSGSRNLISTLQRGPGSLGKNAIFTQLITPDDSIPVSCPLQYSYINSKDITDPHSLKISKVNIYTLEQPELKTLLEFALNAKALDKTLFAIVLDWANPWRFTQDLDMWINIWHEMLGKVMTQVKSEDKDALVKSVEEYVKMYKEPDGVAKEPKLADGVLEVNLGVPVMVICCKSDLVWAVDKNRDLNERMLDVALRTLREFCVKYGAALFYTSGKSNANMNVLYEYIMHRIYGFEFKHKAQTIVRDQIFIPAGWDSPELIKQTDYLTGEKQFQDLLQKPKTRVTHKEEVPVISDQEFLIQLKEKLESTTKSHSKNLPIIKVNKLITGGEVACITAEQTQENAPKGPQIKLAEFYQKLLVKGNKDQ